MSIPNLFLVGLNRAGTTAVASALSMHPDIFLSEQKEPNYFGHDLHTSRKRIGQKDYEQLFEQGCDKRWRLDASVVYFFSETAAHEIKAAVPDAKIIINLRAPESWLKSCYTIGHLYGHDWASPNEAVMRRFDKFDANKISDQWFFEGNFYVEQYLKLPKRLCQYWQLFGKENVHIVWYDELSADADAVIIDILNWLKLPSHHVLVPLINSSEELASKYGRKPIWILKINKKLRESRLFTIYSQNSANASNRVLLTLIYTGAMVWKRMYHSSNLLLRRFQIGSKRNVKFELSPEIRHQLAKDVEPALAELEALTGRNLAHWRIV